VNIALKSIGKSKFQWRYEPINASFYFRVIIYDRYMIIPQQNTLE